MIEARDKDKEHNISHIPSCCWYYINSVFQRRGIIVFQNDINSGSSSINIKNQFIRNTYSNVLN